MTHTYIFEIIMALAAGFLGAIAGGGGLITLPLLMFLGEPALTSIGTNKMLACLTTTSSASVFIKKGYFTMTHWKYCILFTVIGSVLGVLSIQAIPSKALEKFLPYLILAVCVYAILKKSHRHSQTTVRGDSNKLSSSLIGLLLGFYGGFIGAGIGLFWTSWMMAKYKMNIMYATAVSRAMCLIGNSIAFLAFALLGHVNYKTGLIIGLAMAIGSFFGAHMALKLGEKFIKAMLSIMCVLMCVSLILKG